MERQNRRRYHSDMASAFREERIVLILDEKTPADMLSHVESEMFFDDMIKCVMDTIEED